MRHLEGASPCSRRRAATTECKSGCNHQLTRSQSSTIDLKLCIGTLEKDETIAYTKKEKAAKILEKKDEIVANIIWRFLDVRG